MTITVVGGAYREVCIAPELDQFYGSGGRAAAALSTHDDIEFHTYASGDAKRHLRNLASRYPITIRQHTARHMVSFEYDHALSPPRVQPPASTITNHRPIYAKGDVVLLFGMLEGRGQVHGKSVVYDPQSELNPARFRGGGNKATRLAIVVNQAELKELTGVEEPRRGALALMRMERAQALFVKQGADGVLAGEGNRWKRVPAYFSERVIPIGSGDIFSAAVALFWGKLGMSAAAAADLASRCVADYVERRDLPIADRPTLRAKKFVPVNEARGRVYLAGPFFNLQQRRLIEEVLAILESAKLKVISPLHDIGRGSAKVVARADLDALRSCDRVFAILEGCDPGTLFEVGYARAKGIPVFAYTETVTDENLTMFIGSGCHVFSDLVTAIYRTKWKR